MNGFLASLSGRERSQIAAIAAAIADGLRTWSAPYGVLDAVRFPAVALSTAASAPWLPFPDLMDMALVPVWIFALDDAFDRGVFAAWERGPRARRYADMAAGEGAGGGDPYAAALADIVARLGRRPLWPSLRGEWEQACRLLLAGMVFECACADGMRRGARPPSLRAYMDRGLHSIGVPTHLVAAWIIDDDPGTPQKLPELRAMARCAGRALRLANDLRTDEKEREEGNLNALMLLRAQGATDDAAAQALRRRLAASLVRLRHLEGRLPGTSAARLSARVTRFAVDFYAEHDYHEVPRQGIDRV